MASSTKEKPEKDYEKIEQYVLSFAKDFNMEKFVGFDKKLKSYYPSEDFENSTDVVQQIDAYDEYQVWEALVLSLSHRDIVKKFEKRKWNKCPRRSFLKKNTSYSKVRRRISGTWF